MEIIISAVALLASMLTFFSGFGLGTLLTPVMLIYFKPAEAIALTAIVHLLNNIFKFILVRDNFNKEIFLNFGLYSVLGAFIGAIVLNVVGKFPVIFTYEFQGLIREVSLLKISIGLIILFFTVIELKPNQLSLKSIPVSLGGIISGFFGGISGNQGALRTLFLVRFPISKLEFIATGIAIACAVDIIRIPIYFATLKSGIVQDELMLMSAAILSAFVGSFLGNMMLKKVTFYLVQKITSLLLILIATLLIIGII